MLADFRFIKRGNYGNVFGVEVSLHEYFTFTTERIEKAGNVTLSGEINVQIEGAQTTYVTMKPEDMKGGIKLSELSDNATLTKCLVDNR